MSDSKERVRRHRKRKEEERAWYDDAGKFRGWICSICKLKKDEDDFRVRGRGREKACLDCAGGESTADQHRGFEQQDALFYALQRKQGIRDDEKP